MYYSSGPRTRGTGATVRCSTIELRPPENGGEDNTKQRIGNPLSSTGELISSAQALILAGWADVQASRRLVAKARRALAVGR